MYLFCFVKQPICQTPTKMSPADAEDTLMDNLFSSYLISGSPYHFQVSGLLGIALDLLTDVADSQQTAMVIMVCFQMWILTDRAVGNRQEICMPGRQEICREPQD